MQPGSSPADDTSVTIGTEVRVLDDVAAALRRIATGAMAYSDELVLRLADQIEQVVDRTQQTADLEPRLR
jgi:hypothetical protein